MHARSLLWAVVLGCLWGIVAVGWAEPATVPMSNTLATLIDQLGSDQFHQREAAMQALDELGAEALPALRSAQHDADIEVARRAAVLTRVIEKRLETAQLLAPRRIRLVYQDVPLSTALADFAKQSGCTFRYDGIPADTLATRRVSLDTGEVSFWEALEQFCQKAGVHELLQPAAIQEEVIKEIQKRQIIMNRPYQPVVPQPTAGTITLADGPPTSLPTHLAGAVRVRAIPSTTAEANGFTVEISPEAGMAWVGLVDVRIHHARDDRGQDRVQAPAPPVSLIGMENIVWQGNMAQGIVFSEAGGQAPPISDGRQVPIRLEPAKEPTRKLAEVHGILAARVQSPVQDIVAIDNILQAAGRDATSDDGETLKVVSVTPQNNGWVRLRVEARSADGAGGGGGGVMRINGVAFVNRAPVQGNAVQPTLVLIDAQGKEFKLINRLERETTIGPDGIIRTYEIDFQPQTGQAEAAKLVWRGRRTVTIETPFVLKDVPLTEK
ncbi:MAG: HEAT repeat domain-containing protein [Gemmataceae bacterium]